MAPSVTNRSQQAISARAGNLQDPNDLISEERTLAQYYINKTHDFDPRENYLNNLHSNNTKKDVGIHDMARIAAEQLSSDMIEQGVSGEEQMRTITELKNYALARYGDIESKDQPEVTTLPDYQKEEIPQPIPQSISQSNEDMIEIPLPQRTGIPLAELERIPSQQPLAIKEDVKIQFQIAPSESLKDFSLATSSSRHREIFLRDMMTRRNLNNAV